MFCKLLHQLPDFRSHHRVFSSNKICFTAFFALENAEYAPVVLALRHLKFACTEKHKVMMAEKLPELT